jgi:hypothetical protein
MLNNNVITIQNTNDIKSLIENSNLNLNLTIPNLYLNYLKILAYPFNSNESYARPYIDNQLMNYEFYNEDQKTEFNLQKGEHILLVYPDTILTKEMLRFNERINNPVVTTIFDYDCKSKKIVMMGKQAINNENVELYRNISTFLQFSKPIKTKTTFKECDFKPLVYNGGKTYSDIRELPFFEDLEKSDTAYKLIQETTMLRYISKLDTLDEVCSVDGKMIDFPVDIDQKSYYMQMMQLLHEPKSEQEIETESGMKVRLLVKLLKQMSLVNLLKFTQIPKVPCLIIKYDTEEDVTLTLYTKTELLKYNDAIKSYNIIEDKWLKLVKIVIKIYQICYFMNSEEILRMLIKNNGISINIVHEKDRKFLRQLIDRSDFNEVLSILIQIWQFSKDKTLIN